MNGVLILILFGALFFLLGWIFWDMEESNESFWDALLEALADIFLDFTPGFRTVALLFWLIGFLIIILGIVAFFNPAVLDLFPAFQAPA